MACGYAKYSGKLGVCLATSGPGGIHLLNGLYDAKLDGQPVLAITGHHYHDLIDTHAQQDVNLDRLFADVAVYNTRVMGPAHVENVVDLACRTALGYRGVAHINFPVDLQDQEVRERSKRNVANHTSDVLAHRARLPAEADIVRAAAVSERRKEDRNSLRARSLGCHRRAGRSCREIRRADHQGIARKGGCSGYEPVHDGRNRTARDQAVARGPRRMRHSFDGGDIVSLYRVLAQAGGGTRRSNRPRSRSYRFALPG